MFTLMGSFLVYAAAPGKRAEPGFLRYSSRTERVFSSPPKTLSWQALNYLHSSLCLNCSNMLEVDQTERLFFFFFGARGRQELPAVGCWGSDMITGGKEQRLVGTVKDARTRAAHQNSFGETGMKYPPTASASQTCQNSTSVWRRI